MRRIGTLLAAVALLSLPGMADAALTLQGMGKPARLTLATTQKTLTLPQGTEYLRIRPITITAYLEIGCTDGAALGDSGGYETITADVVEVRAVHMYDVTGGAVCLAGSGAGTVEVTPLARGK